MADANTIVDLVDGFRDDVDEVAKKGRKDQQAADKVVSVSFAGGGVGLLDLTQPRAATWLRVLHMLHDRQTPAYVEVEPRSQKITRLLQPMLQPVGDIQPLNKGSDLRVELLNSHALHVLRRSHPRFGALRRLLVSARDKKTSVWVTETLDTHEIIDVRPAK